jgi:hypothetical protein
VATPAIYHFTYVEANKLILSQGYYGAQYMYMAEGMTKHDDHDDDDFAGIYVF